MAGEKIKLKYEKMKITKIAQTKKLNNTQIDNKKNLYKNKSNKKTKIAHTHKLKQTNKQEKNYTFTAVNEVRYSEYKNLKSP